MSVFNKVLNLFKYEPAQNYNFVLMGDEQEEKNISYKAESNSSDYKVVFSDLSKNLEYINIKFNTLINSDIVVREFNIYARNKQYSAFLFYIDGMSDSELINDFVIKPLMLRNRANTFEDDGVFFTNKTDGSTEDASPTDNFNNIKKFKWNTDNSNHTKKINSSDDKKPYKIKISADKIKCKVSKKPKFDLKDYIFNCLLPQNDVKQTKEFSDLISGVNSGNCALFIDTLDIGFDIDVKGFKQRSISTPTNELVIKGPQEAFVENIRTNTSLLRRTINNENLIIENIDVGNLSKTKCGVCYLKDIANSSLVAEVKYRLNNLEIDSLISSGQLEQLIEKSNSFGIPQILSTERPDKCTKALYDGKVIILINGNPYALILPSTFVDFISSPEDTNLKPQFANLLKFIRLFAMFITLLLPSLWIAITNFHQELIPTELLFSIVASRENVPFPVIFEVLLMEISFELIREASLRVPSPVGSTIGIVGALVLGDAAVSASIVSPILIIVIAITGIASFAIPDFYFGFHIRIMRFAFILFAFIAGFLGIGLLIFVYITILCSLKSFGVPYMVTFAPLINSTGSSYFVHYEYKRERRPDYLNTKRPTSQKHLSMKWKYK